MALNLMDCVVGTIVDHRWQKVNDDDRPDSRWHLERRDLIRRGIITGVNGDIHLGVHSVAVKFDPDSAAEEVPTCELDRVAKANSRIARIALARVTGSIIGPGSVFKDAQPARRERVVDGIGLGAIKRDSLAREDAMAEEDANPLVVTEGPSPAEKKASVEPAGARVNPAK